MKPETRVAELSKLTDEPKPKCHHEHFTLHHAQRIAVCNDCDAVLDLFSVARDLAKMLHEREQTQADRRTGAPGGWWVAW
jgi:transcription initiation factor TFIIIB Brf1 subunit/transcription initiation factor TFIIB